MPTHVIYARKSTESDDRQVLSIDSQVQELKVLALRRGLQVDEVLTESKSAKAPGRQVFGTLMKRVGRGEIAGILCWKMDRLARNHFDTGQVLQALADKKIEHVITAERTYTADGNDRFLGNFEFGIATKFIDDLRSNVKRGNRARFQRGWPNYRPPVGYLEDHATKTIVKDAERFPLVRRMWDEFLSGRLKPMAISRAAEEWGLRTRRTAQQGGKPLTFQYLFRLFANPFYMGLIQLKSGETYKGAYEPMVTPDEFDAAQQLLGRSGRTRPLRHIFAYAGMLGCGLCGKSLVPEAHTKRSGKRFVYYRCRGRTNGQPCPNPCLPETALEAKFLADLKRVTLPRKAAEWIFDNIKTKLDATLSEQAAQRTGLEKALADSIREGDALITLKLRGQVDDSTFERRRLGLLDSQAKLRLRLDQPAPPPDALLARVREVLNFSASLPHAFHEGDAVRRRQIFRAVCANPIVREKKALYKANEPWSFFEGSRLMSSWWTVVERMRTWIVEKNFWLPPLYMDDDENLERRRRAGVPHRFTRRARSSERLLSRSSSSAQRGGGASGI